MLELSHLPRLPERIQGLAELAYNLWWTWHRSAHDLFRALDLQVWRESGDNPIRMLNLLDSDTLERAAADPSFLRHYDSVMAQFKAELGSPVGWFPAEYGHPEKPLVYLSAEFGLHASLPVYAGGLGILAGDYLKECSDLAIPVIGIGLIYSHGYTTQIVRADGWPEDVEGELDRSFDPIKQVLDADGNPLIVQVPLFDPPLHVTVWKVAVGRVSLYLLDSDLEINQPWDREITQHLYASEPEQRLRQEILLGMGGMRVLETLNLEPGALHINEGHPALALVDRLSRLVQSGLSWDDALARVQQTTVFTTHTPLAAGTDVFRFDLMEKYFGRYLAEAGIDRAAFLGLGLNPADPKAGFNMTVFALRASGYRNAVSKRHGEVAREIWVGLWPERKREDVPIESVTNGVHLPSWIGTDAVQPLLDRYLGPAWLADEDQPEAWELVQEIPDDELWNAHHAAKCQLIDQITERARLRWQKDQISSGLVVAFGAFLDPDVLTIGFARRFTAYKRPDLILSDVARLTRLLTNPHRPVQIIFAGKAHPADLEGKRLIQSVVRLGQDPALGGRITFVENYDQELAASLVQGVDVWLNTPLPPFEASGTSGIKASVNGVPQLSILDGWWVEGYSEGAGWAFAGSEPGDDRKTRDAEKLYRLLEEQIIPLFYQRSDDGIPHEYVQVMKAAIAHVAPRFSTRRMVQQYTNQFYAPALDVERCRGN